MENAKRIFIGLVGFFFCLVLPLEADEIGQLKEKMRVLQEENRFLHDKLKSQDTLIQDLAARLERLETKEAEQLVEEREVVPRLVIPKMQIRGFGDFGFKAEKADNTSDASPSTFAFSELTFFITSQLSDKISLLNENAIEFEEAHTEIDVERLYLRYSLSELFNITLGRYHTPLGYWNATFHHGKWFQTTDSRPLIVEYEHESGIMPMHIVGINFDGKKALGLFDLEYNFGVGNGRANLRTKVQNHQDGNDAKAFNTLLTLKPHCLPGFRFGFSAYVDKIPAATTPSNRMGEIKERILGGYFAFQKDKLEVLFEGYDINHEDELSQRDYETVGLYLQGSYKLKEKWTPYYRFDFLDFGRDDPYFTTTTRLDIDTQRHNLGLRWDIATWNALKLEYSYSDRKDASDKHAISLNNSFHF